MTTPAPQRTAPPARSGIESRVHRLFRVTLELDIEMDTDLIADGMLDSLAFVQLLVALEEEFGIRFDISELELDDFSTVAGIARLVTASDQGAA